MPSKRVRYWAESAVMILTPGFTAWGLFETHEQTQTGALVSGVLGTLAAIGTWAKRSPKDPAP